MNGVEGGWAVWVGSEKARRVNNPNCMRTFRCLEYRGKVAGKKGDDLSKISKPLVVRSGKREGKGMYFASDAYLLPLPEDQNERTAALVSIKLRYFE